MDINETIKQVMEGKKKWQKTGLANAEDDPVASKNSKPMKKEDSDKSEPGTQGDDEEYAKKRDAVLKKFGVESCAQCETDEEKKACFKALDDAHVADHEEQKEAQELDYSKKSTDKKSGAKLEVGGTKKKSKEPQEQKEHSRLFSQIRKMMKGE